jgi:hypothetical protein
MRRHGNQFNAFGAHPRYPPKTSPIDFKNQGLRPLMERFGATKKVPSIAKRLKEMVGTRRLELLTSTVSIRSVLKDLQTAGTA